MRYPAGLVSANTVPNALYPSGSWTNQQAAPYISNGVWAQDPYFNQTALLLHGDGANGAQNNTFLDSSGNNFSITRVGNATQGAFSPFCLADGYWSNSFNGTTDFITIPANAAFVMGTGDFTIECWVNTPPAIGGGVNNDKQIFGSFSFSPSFLAFLSHVNNAPAFWNGSLQITANIPVPSNTWTHVAWVRSNGTLTFYVNGVNAGSNAYATNWTGSNTIFIGKSSSDSTRFYPGYISNLRVVKGTAVYTSAFTPGTIPLTTITNTSLLTCQSNRYLDKSSNAFALTPNSTVRVAPFGPFPPPATYDPSVNIGSASFDGSGDYLRRGTAGDAAFNFGSGNFTIEMWAWTNVLKNYNSYVGENPGTTNNTIHFGSDNVGGMFVTLTSVNVQISPPAGTIRAGEWQHIALVRNSGVTTMYVNGTSRGTPFNSSANMSLGGSAGFVIGSGHGGGDLNGYISNLRILKGVAQYTANFTPPSAPVGVVANTSFLLNAANAGIFDSTGRNVLETVGDAQIDTAVIRYGTGSMEFDGTGDYLVIPANRIFDLGIGDFTLEAWVYSTSYSSSYNTIVNRWTSTTTKSWLWYITATGMTFFWSTNGSDQASVSASTTLTTYTWRHLAVTRSGNGVRFFVNGVQIGATQSVTATVFAATTALHVGILGDLNSTTIMRGFIDDLRVTTGIARYTSNFTPPIQRFPNQ